MGNQLCFGSPSPHRFQNNQAQAQTQQSTARSTPDSPLKSPLNAKILQKIKNRNLFDGLMTNVTGQFKKQWVQVSSNFAYQGEWQGGKIHGRGIMYNFQQHWLICGCFLENQIVESSCRKIFSNGLEYVGQTNEKFEMHGIGRLIGQKFSYKGEFRNNKYEGEGQLQSESLSFKGFFEAGKKISGVEITPQGSYEGPFQNDKRQGNGTFTWNGGGKYEGSFKNNKIDGKGKLFDSEGNFSGFHTFQDGRILM